VERIRPRHRVPADMPEQQHEHTLLIYMYVRAMDRAIEAVLCV